MRTSDRMRRSAAIASRISAARVRVNRFSMIRVGHNVYSVASRLIGESVEVRLYPERLEVRYAGEGVADD